MPSYLIIKNVAFSIFHFGSKFTGICKFFHVRVKLISTLEIPIGFQDGREILLWSKLIYLVNIEFLVLVDDIIPFI